MVNNEQFLEACNNRFSFLTSDYDLNQVCEKSDDWGFEMTYKSKIVGVNLTFELRDFYLYVKIVKLRDGNFPSNPEEIHPNSLLGSFDLDDIVGIRSPESLLPPHNRSTVFDVVFFNKIMTIQANNLKMFASDLLGGDFTIFAELDKIVKERARVAAFQKWENRAVEFGWTK